MKLQNIVIGIIFISLIVTGSTLFLASLGDKYDVDYGNETLNNTLYQTEQYLETANELSEIVTDITLEDPTDFIIVPYQLIKGGWTVIKTVFESWNLITAVISDVGNALTGSLGIPGTLIGAVIAIIILSLVFILVYGFFKWRFDDRGN